MAPRTQKKPTNHHTMIMSTFLQLTCEDPSEKPNAVTPHTCITLHPQNCETPSWDHELCSWDHALHSRDYKLYSQDFGLHLQDCDLPFVRVGTL